MGTLHPLLSFVDPVQAIADLEGCGFALEGESEAVGVATQLVTAFGGQVLNLNAQDMPLYHAGAVLASNGVVALSSVAKRVLEAAGVNEKVSDTAIGTLLASVANNILAHGVTGGLTGPVLRGESDVVGAHVAALTKAAVRADDVYRRLGGELLALAKRHKRAPSGEKQVEVAAAMGLSSKKTADVTQDSRIRADEP